MTTRAAYIRPELAKRQASDAKSDDSNSVLDIYHRSKGSLMKLLTIQQLFSYVDCDAIANHQVISGYLS